MNEKIEFVSDSEETSRYIFETISRVRHLLHERSSDFSLKDRNFDWTTFAHTEINNY